MKSNDSLIESNEKPAVISNGSEDSMFAEMLPLLKLSKQGSLSASWLIEMTVWIEDFAK